MLPENKHDSSVSLYKHLHRFTRKYICRLLFSRVFAASQYLHDAKLVNKEVNNQTPQKIKIK